jgi:hypothetical protein
MKSQSRLKKILATSALVIAGLAGCDKSNSNYHTPAPIEIISGKPLSVAIVYENLDRYSNGNGLASSHGVLSTVIEVDNKKVLAYGYTRKGAMFTLSGDAALIQAEIADGDDDLVTLTGSFCNGIFDIKALKVEGYTTNYD